MAENAFTKYKDFLPSDYLREELATADQQYMLDQESKSKMFGYPDKRFVPNQRETDTSKLQSAFSYLGLPPEKSLNYARDFTGRPEIESIGRSLGVADFTGYGPLAYDLPQNIKDFKKAREEGSVGGQAMSAGFGLLNLAEVIPIAGLGFKAFNKPIKGFAKSISEKLNNIDTTPQLGALPSNKVIANTVKKQPSMAMTDPKVVDEFGFYSEAERQAKMMQQNKGSGAQFQGMLLNKGVKLDEIKALGLDDLFKNEKVTKKEIVDTIDLNKFQLIEKKRIGTDSTVGYEMESFTDIRGTDGSSFANIDEIKNAHDTGKYERPVIRYEDGTYNGFETAYEGEQLTHVPTQHKIVRLESTDSTRDEVFFTFKPNAKTDDWRNSNEAKQYVDEINEERGEFGLQDKKAETGNLTTEDFDTIVKEYAPYSFDEATVRLQSAAEDGGNVPFAKFESSTQKGGENYKEFVLSLPPFDKTKGYQDKVDINFPQHFPEYNPVFHIRTKDRVTTDGKKVLYVEELQSDFGQKGRDKGFRLKGDDLEKAKAKLAVAEDNLMELKDIQVKIYPAEAEELFALRNPNVSPPNNVTSYPSYATIEEIAKLKQYRNYKVLHKLGDLSDEFFNQLDLSQMGRTQAEIKSELISMLTRGRIGKASVANEYSKLGQSANLKVTRKEVEGIFDKYFKAFTQAKGEDAPIPDAPFVKDTEKWTGLAIKRLLQMAEKGEYDHIAFSPGSVQFDRWGEEGLIEYYDEIIPQVASKLPKSLGVTTSKITVPIKSEVDVGVAVTYDGKYFVRNDGSDKAIEGKLFNNEGDAFDYADMIRSSRTNQETFAINITPKMKETVRGGMPLFSTVGGMLGVGATISNQDIGGLGSLPNDQT